MNANASPVRNYYQHDYSLGQPKMFDICSRTIRGVRVLTVLTDYIGEKNLSKCNVLDVGCSAGIIDSVIASHVKTLIGVDIDRTAISYARSHNQHKNARYFIGNGTKLTFKNESFDCVICSQTYDHVENSDKLFTEIYRVLKPGGICYLSGPNKWFPIDSHTNLPFISLLSQSQADRVLRFIYKKKKHYEKPKSYWELQQELRNFHIIDYTSKILRNPIKYSYNVPFILYFVSPIAKYLMPTFIWVLHK